MDQMQNTKTKELFIKSDLINEISLTDLSTDDQDVVLILSLLLKIKGKFLRRLCSQQDEDSIIADS